MRVNGKRVAAANEDDLPSVISLRITGHALRPLLQKWRAENLGVPWACLIEQALRGESPLPALAGKRHAHLVHVNGESKPEVAA